jgi:murein DD-endopeptidase MepM/ murein hydrolase activator NlpD
MRFPLEKMVIRTALHESLDEDLDRLKVTASPIGGAFGLVRSSGAKPHAGWDLYSTVNAAVYAVADSLVATVSSSFAPEECKANSYGNSVCILLTDPGLQSLRDKFKCELFAFYGHLASVEVDAGDQLREGWLVGTVGRSGNACHSPAHLHFEIRTVATPPPKSGLRYRIDPGELLGYDNYSSRSE